MLSPHSHPSTAQCQPELIPTHPPLCPPSPMLSRQGADKGALSHHTILLSRSPTLPWVPWALHTSSPAQTAQRVTQSKICLPHLSPHMAVALTSDGTGRLLAVPGHPMLSSAGPTATALQPRQPSSPHGPSLTHPKLSACLGATWAVGPGGQPYLRTAALFWALILSHHLEKKEISDQMKRRRGSSCIFSTMLLRMCCVWS